MTGSAEWIVINNVLYDVSELEHPGGDVLYTHLGEDATDVFAAFHASSTFARLKEFRVDESPPIVVDDDEIVRDFRALRADLRREGMFRASGAYYAGKCASTAAICLASLVLLRLGRWVESGAVMGLFWQQSGWLSHDFVHHQVFVSRWKNDAFGYFWGNLCQGFSVAWWKSKHNVHHATTNRIGSDPDIDTVPLIAWSEDMIDGSTWTGLIRYQHLLFFPILAFSRFSWSLQSLIHGMFVAKSAIETITLALHYAWVAVVASSTHSWATAAAWYVVAQAVSGLCLSLVFVQSHNGMDVQDRRRGNFYVTQLDTTRDVTGSFFGWFSGGLHLQIEHHMFPTMPRHNLRRAQDRVKAVCRKHGLRYEECGFLESTARVLRRLRAVALASSSAKSKSG